jgi:hypothetical protein
MVYGLWSMVYGLWSMVYGLRQPYGLRSMVYGLWSAADPGGNGPPAAWPAAVFSVAMVRPLEASFMGDAIHRRTVSVQCRASKMEQGAVGCLGREHRRLAPLQGIAYALCGHPSHAETQSHSQRGPQEAMIPTGSLHSNAIAQHCCAMEAMIPTWPPAA